MLDRRRRRGDDLVLARRDPQPRQPLDVPGPRDGRVVRGEADGHLVVVEPRDELASARNRLVTPVDHAVEVEDDETNARRKAGHRADHTERARPDRCADYP
jgi:hypothetical protein